MAPKYEWKIPQFKDQVLSTNETPSVIQTPI